jgi:hypothetical protein
MKNPPILAAANETNKIRHRTGLRRYQSPQPLIRARMLFTIAKLWCTFKICKHDSKGKEAAHVIPVLC